MKILIFDIETMGMGKDALVPWLGKIAEIGIVELDLETGERKIIFDEVCHEKPITREIVEKSWIVTEGYMTVDEIRKSRDLRLMLREIQDIIYKYPNGATAYNKKFDFGFLQARGLEFPRLLPCPMILMTDICKIHSPYKPGSWKWPKVEEAYDFIFPDNDYTEIHRGADDAMHEAEIVHWLYKKGIFKI